MHEPYALPDNHEQILRSIAADVNRELAASQSWRDYVAVWETRLRADADTLALYLQNRRLRMTVFVQVPAKYAWGYLTSSADRTRVQSLIASRLGRLGSAIADRKTMNP